MQVALPVLYYLIRTRLVKKQFHFCCEIDILFVSRAGLVVVVVMLAVVVKIRLYTLLNS